MTLAEKTKAYWDVSTCWNGKQKGKPYTVQEAIKKLNTVLGGLNPKRPVARLSSGLLADIINKTDKPAKAANTGA